MQIRKKDQKNIFVSGIFVSVSLALALIFTSILTKDSPLFSEKIDLHTIVSNAKNLKIGAPVQLKGIKIGSINSIIFTGLDKIKINFTILKDYQKWIKVDGNIEIKTQGVLGDKFIEIQGGSDNAKIISAGSSLKASRKSGMDNFINKGEDILVVVTRVLQKIDSILGPIEDTNLQDILSNLERSSRNTNKLLTNINKANIGKMSKELEIVTSNLKSITGQIQEGPGTLHSLIYDKSMHDDLNSLLGGAKRNKVLKYFIRESIKRSEND